MPPNGLDGRGAAADSSPGKFEVPPWLRDIRRHAAANILSFDVTREHPIHLAASGLWLFRLHPFGQIFWRWFWQAFLWFSLTGMIVCGAGLLWVNFLNSATLTAAKYAFSGTNGTRLFYNIALLVGFIVLVLCAWRTKRPIVRYGKYPGKGFFLLVNFDSHWITSATDFDANLISPQPQPDYPLAIAEHPSTIQNTLPRLYDLQEIGGRIKLRSNDVGPTYFFESCRWLLGDIFIVSIGFIPAIVTLMLFVDVFALRQWSLFGIAAPAWASYAVLLFALLFGIAITLYIVLQRWIVKRAIVIVAFGPGQTAALVWNQYLGIRKGFQSDEILFDYTDELGEFCRRLMRMQNMGKLLRLSQEHPEQTT